MNKSIIFTAVFISSIFSESYAGGMLPLTTWIQNKNFTTLSVEDTITVTQRCSIAYDINRTILEEYTNMKAQGLREKVEKYRWVNSRFAVLSVKNKNKSQIDAYTKQLVERQQYIYQEYYKTMRDNEPVPFSLAAELIATDIGVCNTLDEKIFDAYKMLNN